MPQEATVAKVGIENAQQKTPANKTNAARSSGDLAPVNSPKPGSIDNKNKSVDSDSQNSQGASGTFMQNMMQMMMMMLEMMMKMLMGMFGAGEGKGSEKQELGDNLIENGDFEKHPDLKRNKWDTFKEVDGWKANSGHIEIQEGKHWGTNNVAGNRVAELDAHGNSEISQNVNVAEGGKHKFSLDYAMRGNDQSSNGFEVYVDGKLQKTVTPDSKDFSKLEFDLDLSKGDHKIDIRGIGKSDGIGTLIDNVKLQRYN